MDALYELAPVCGLGQWEVFGCKGTEVRKVTEPTRCITGAEKAATRKEESVLEDIGKSGDDIRMVANAMEGGDKVIFVDALYVGIQKML